jgi:hypothetical protein
MEWKQPHLRRRPTPAEIEETLAEISLLNGQIEALQAQISAIQLERDHKMSFISSFRCLPSELLCVIAEEYTRQGGDPMVLAQTCSTLFYAVNGMKSLWSPIYIGDSRKRRGKRIKVRFACRCLNIFVDLRKATKCTNLDYFAVLLERVAPVPLSIIIAKDYFVPDVLQVLEPFTAFVHSFKIDEDLSIKTEDQPIDRVSRLTFPNLQHLEIQSKSAPYTICLLELGSRSRQDIPAFELHLECNHFTQDMFQHGLFQRITTLNFCLCKLTSLFLLLP